jgi:hypothetical protein
VAIECPEGNYKFVGTNSLTKINGAFKKINSKTKDSTVRDNKNISK